jgi:hypothetical protein
LPQHHENLPITVPFGAGVFQVATAILCRHAFGWATGGTLQDQRNCCARLRPASAKHWLERSSPALAGELRYLQIRHFLHCSSVP